MFVSEYATKSSLTISP